ncbi:hypothetical protein GQ607_006437, partial [Colletotrichum asianum]
LCQWQSSNLQALEVGTLAVLFVRSVPLGGECGSWRSSCQQEEKKKAGRQIDPPRRQNAGHWSKTIGNVNDSIEAGACLPSRPVRVQSATHSIHLNESLCASVKRWPWPQPDGSATGSPLFVTLTSQLKGKVCTCVADSYITY